MSTTLLVRRPFNRFVLRPISLAVCLVGAAPATFGLPQGAQVSFGQASVKQGSAQQITSPRAAGARASTGRRFPSDPMSGW